MSKLASDIKHYNVGYCRSHTKMLQERVFSTCENFLLPYLKRGMKVLDCGCGPGTISVGIAEKIYPGELVGIDIYRKHIKLAQQTAKQAGLKNTKFVFGSVFALPFVKNSFDLVFAQALLAHFKNPIMVLKEMLRVLKPGGIIALREPYYDKFILYPRSAIINEAFTKRWSVADKTGDYCLGLKLHTLLRQLNLKQIKHQFACENKNVAVHCKNLAHEVMEYPYFKQLLSEKKISLARLKLYKKAWLEFAHNPDACYAVVWGETAGIK
jgi:ubiquinone/menaquinone biosynthesis C-methylase UbiE